MSQKNTSTQLCDDPYCGHCNFVRLISGLKPLTPNTQKSTETKNEPNVSNNPNTQEAMNQADIPKEQAFANKVKETLSSMGFGVEIVFLDNEEDEDETPSAEGFLEKALGHMLDRADTYDKPEGERSMAQTVEAFNAITGRDLKESEGWLLLQLLKDVRLFSREQFHQDSAEDCIAYAALKAEAKASEG